MGEVHRLVPSETVFGLQAAGRLMNKIFAPWVQDLSLLAESVEAVRPPGALPDWQPGAVVRLPFSKKNCCDGEVVCRRQRRAGTRILPPLLSRQRSRAMLAHDRRGVRLDRGRSLYLRHRSAAAAVAGLSARLIRVRRIEFRASTGCF